LKRSQRSNAALEPDKPVTVTYLFEDGERREVEMRAIEADALLDEGRRTTSWWNRAFRTGGRWLKPAAKVGAVALVGALLGAAISDHYADKQKANDLVVSLTKSISTGGVKLFQNAQEASRATENPFQSEQRDRAADAWVLHSGSITPIFRAYFGSEGVAAHWDQYQAAMYDWAVLGCCTTSSGRPELLHRIRDYLREHVGPPTSHPPVVDPWIALDSARPPADVYQWLGLYLLRGRGKILEDLQSAKPDLD
jgi:hypothetical protein